MTETITSTEYKKLQKKQPKYRNKKVIHEGDTFDSIKELNEYVKLQLLAKQGYLWDLKRQVKFDIVVNGVKICSYIADMCYSDIEGFHVVDIKSEITKKLPVFRLKQKLMKAVLGITIETI